MNYFLHRGINVKNIIDHMAKPVTDAQYLEAVGNDNLIFECTTNEEIESTYLYDLDNAPIEQAKFYDAIKTTKSRIESTMAAFGRALNSQMNSSGLSADTAEIGAPRKAGQFAVMSATFPVSDGQAISIIFHSPTNDPSKITEQDDLIAFRFLLNKRDVTHVVAPSGGQDISLKQTTLTLANLTERNSARFQAKQAENKKKQDELKTVQDATSQLQQEATTLTTQADDLNKQQQDATDAVSRTQTLLDKQKARNDALQAQLDGLKVPPPVVPEPTIKGDENKPKPSGSDIDLVNPDNRPQVDYELPYSTGKVVKSTDKMIDVLLDGGFGKRSTTTRYTWDGVGYKNKGAYLMKDGSIKQRNELPDSLFYQTSLPTDSFTSVRKALENGDSYTLDNSAHVSSFMYLGDQYVEITDSMDKNKTYRINAGSDLIEGAKKLYTAYKAGKADSYLVTDRLPRDQPNPPKAKPAGIGDTVTASNDLKYKITALGMGSASMLLSGDSTSSQFSISQLNDIGVIVGGVNDEDYVEIAKSLLNDVEQTTNPNGTLDFATQDRLVDHMKKLQVSEYSNGLVYGAQQAVNARNAEILAEKRANPTPEPEPAPTEQTLFWYGLRARPLGIGAQPQGQVAFIEKDSVASDPRTAGLVADTDESNYRWGVIAYDHKLTDTQKGNYELVDLAEKQWNAATRAKLFVEFKDVFSRMIDSNSTLPEITADLIKPNGALIQNNPFYDTEKNVYMGGQLLTAMQEAGYTGSLASMVGQMYDELTTTDEDRAYQAEQEARQKAKDNQQAAIDAVKALMKGIRLPKDWVKTFDEKGHDGWTTVITDNIPESFDFQRPTLFIETPPISEGDEPFDFRIFPNLDDNGALVGTFSVTYVEGSPISDEAGSVTTWDAAMAAINGAITDEKARVDRKNNPTPEPTPPATEAGNATVTKALADLQELFDNETNIDAYLMKMEAAFNEIDTAGATAENEPFMQKVADKLTALMAAEGVAA